MSRTAKTPDRDATSYKSDLRAARPLLQAIVLGVLLAAGLMVAAAMAGPDGRVDPHPSQGSETIQAEPQPAQARTLPAAP